MVQIEEGRTPEEFLGITNHIFPKEIQISENCENYEISIYYVMLIKDRTDEQLSTISLQ